MREPRPAVVVMARAPRPGQGKTRLRTALSDDDCLRLQEALLRDAVDAARDAAIGPAHLSYTPADAAPWIEGAFDTCARFPQQGHGLGARLLAALRHVEALGYAPAVVIGTDTPLLQPRHLRAALRSLMRADVCVGPSADGGYYLLASRTVQPQLFDGVPWGTNRVLDTTLRLAAESGLRYALLETLYDIDTPEDLDHLRHDLYALADDPAFRMPRHTAELLAS